VAATKLTISIESLNHRKARIEPSTAPIRAENFSPDPTLSPSMQRGRVLVAGTSMHRLPGLDLLRAIAILWVMLFHSWIVGGVGDPYNAVVGYGWMGVDLFFVLSGYLIGYQLLKPLSLGQPLHLSDFYRRRAFRILPAFLTVLAIYVFFPAWREAPGIQPAWQFLTFTVNLLIDYEHNQAFSHAWSLCVEEHFYLLFPLLALLLTRHPSRVVVISLSVFVVIGGMLIRGYACLHGKDYLESIYYPTYTRLDGLMAGVLLAAIQSYQPQRWAALQSRANALAGLGLVVIAVAIWLFRDRSFVPVVFGFPLLALGFALLVTAAASPNGFGRWRIPAASWIAAMSYSLYLSHKLAMHFVASVLMSTPHIPGAVAFLGYIVAIFTCGALLHYGVERPFLRLRDKHESSRHRRGAQPDASPG
jgi:peptidoglycan/LPS O-acetylase OafA/YrhL